MNSLCCCCLQTEPGGLQVVTAASHTGYSTCPSQRHADAFQIVSEMEDKLHIHPMVLAQVA